MYQGYLTVAWSEGRSAVIKRVSLVSEDLGSSLGEPEINDFCAPL